MSTAYEKSKRQEGYDRCTKCGKFDDLGRHRCDPMWKVWMPECGESEDDATEVYAMFPYSAAEEFCRRNDAQGDYDIIRAGEATVKLRAANGGPVFTAHVHAESVPEYNAQITEDPE